MSESAQILANIFDEKTVAVLQALLAKKDEFFLRDLSRESKVSLATTYRIVIKLTKMGLVSRQEKEKTTEYKIIKDTPVYSKIYSLILGEKPDAIAILKKFMAEQLPQSKMFTLKGNKKKVFIIGEKPASEIFTPVLAEVLKETGEKLTILTLGEEQFTQMQDMGLFKDLVVA